MLELTTIVAFKPAGKLALKSIPDVNVPVELAKVAPFNVMMVLPDIVPLFAMPSLKLVTSEVKLLPVEFTPVLIKFCAAQSVFLAGCCKAASILNTCPCVNILLHPCAALYPM